MKDEKLLKKWLLGKFSSEEEEFFRQSAEYARLIKIWDTLPEVATPSHLDIEHELERFRSTHHSKTEARVIKVSWNRRLIGIAASLVIISVLSYLILQEVGGTETTILSENQMQQFLPDSSTVVLNKGSKLSYKKEDWSNHRSIRLEGEAFFEVNKGSTFDVVTSGGMVRVLGTSFNVKQRDQLYEVMCFEGKVRIKTTSHSAELTAREGFQLIKEDATVFNIDLKDKPDWMKGRSSFYKTPYYAVLSELENQYDIVIETKDMNLQNTFTGSFPNDNLKVALDAITTPSGYLYGINDAKVLISGENN